MNKQEAFDKIWQRAKDQRKSITSDDFCAYRGPDGLKCFVGELIPDKLYSPSMERRSIYYLMNRHPQIKNLFDNFIRDFLEMCQHIHDHYEPSEWHDRLIDLAYENHLKVPE